MESLKKLSDYPRTPSKIFTAENLAKYDNYMKEVIEKSRRADIAAREWASKNFIQFHNGR